MKEQFIDRIFEEISTWRFADESEQFWQEAFALDDQPLSTAISFFYEQVFPKLWSKSQA